MEINGGAESEKCSAICSPERNSNCDVRSPRMNSNPADDGWESVKGLGEHSSLMSDVVLMEYNKEVDSGTNGPEPDRCSPPCSLPSSSTSEKCLASSGRLEVAPVGVNGAGSEKKDSSACFLSISLPFERLQRNSPTRVEVKGTKSDALSLTLFTLGSNFVDNDDEAPVPLTVYYPSAGHGKSVRRSPRFRMDESLITKSAPRKRRVLGERLEQSSCRRSPRLSSSTTLIASPESKVRSSCRRSPQLSSSTTLLASPESKVQSSRRRSPRLSSSTALIASPESKMRSSRRRSPRLSSSTALIASPESEVRSSLRRSQRLSSSTALIASPESEVRSSLRRSPRLSSSTALIASPESKVQSSRRRSPRLSSSTALIASPESEVRSSCRRSPRLSSSTPLPASPESKVRSSCRRSPRLSSSTPLPASPENKVRSSCRRSPQLSSSTALIASPEIKALPERSQRRSPRLFPITSETEKSGRNKLERLPQIGGTALSGQGLCTKVKGKKTTDGPALKRIKLGVDLNAKVVSEECIRKSRWFPAPSASVQRGNDSSEILALTAKSSTETEKEYPFPNGDAPRPFELEFDECKKTDMKVKSDSFGTDDKEDFGHKIALQVRSLEASASLNKKKRKVERELFFVGEPVPEGEAQERWGWRYELKSKKCKGQSWILNAGEEDEVHINVACHYVQASVDGCIFNLGDCAHIRGDGNQEHVGRIVEFFKTSDDENYFRVQWFFRAEDTVMKQAAAFHDKKRLFSSTLMNDNLLDCILSKVKVLEKVSALGLQSTHPSEYYCDMEYSVKYSTFRSLVTATDGLVGRCDLTMPSGLDANNVAITTTPLTLSWCKTYKAELTLLDLYAGCGGMSTGLCLGAKVSGVKLLTRWAIDYHKSACDSLKQNHPETQVRHTTAEDFLELLKEWEKLCKKYVLNDPDRMFETSFDGTKESVLNESSVLDAEVAPGEYEVSSLVDICYGDPSRTGQYGLKFKVRWKGYGPSDDTWELIEGLSNCQGHIRDFVRRGYKSKILPCPGDVDVICGGPPCQGISGYNRFRNTDDPLTDERNQQIVVFFDVVRFLKPKYVLMENVTDILRFDKASLGRYALSRLVHMKYQARLGIMAAGSYGLPQFRLRVFLWGALPSERLPQFPLPTHEVIVRYFPPAEFEQNTVAYDEGQPRELKEAIVLRDAISDLPAVTSHEDREEMSYERPPDTEFQKYIRLTKDEFTGSVPKGITDWKSSVLTDHRPYKLSEDDYHRVCHVPRRKGANFRDFPGVVVGADNMVHRDPTMEQVLLPSGRPLVPDYVFTFEKGKSRRPFARLWWDENVATVVTFPSLHNQAAIHPEQDRVLTVREYARLQGFPDHYRFCGNVKERYCQVGNAVAVFVSKTLGYALGMAVQKLSGDEALMTLPPDFSFQVPPFDEFSAQL